MQILSNVRFSVWMSYMFFILQKESLSRLRVRNFRCPASSIYYKYVTNQVLFLFNNGRGNHFLRMCVYVCVCQWLWFWKISRMRRLVVNSRGIPKSIVQVYFWRPLCLVLYHDNVQVRLVVTWQTITSYSWNKLSTEGLRHCQWHACAPVQAWHWITKMFILSCHNQFQASNILRSSLPIRKY